MKNTLKKTITDISNILLPIDGFLMALRIVFTYSLMDFGAILGAMALFIWGTVFFIILMNTYTKKELIVSILLLICGVLVFKKSNSLIPFYSVAFLIANKRVNLNRVLNGYFLGVLIGLIIVFCNCGVTVFPDGSYSLGLSNPNMLSHFVVMEIVIWVYFRYKKIDWFEFFTLLIFSFLVGIVSKCRTGIGLSFSIIFTAFLCEINIHFREFLRKRINFICISLAIISVLGVVLLHVVPFFSLLNKVLSNRFVLAQVYLGLYGVSPFGVDISDAIQQLGYTVVLDAGYMRLLVNYGVVFLLLYVFVFLKTCKKINRYNFSSCSILILSVFLGLVVESLWIPINTNIIFIFCTIFIFPREGIQRNDNKKTFMKYFFKLDNKVEKSGRERCVFVKIKNIITDFIKVE